MYMYPIDVTKKLLKKRNNNNKKVHSQVTYAF